VIRTTIIVIVAASVGRMLREMPDTSDTAPLVDMPERPHQPGREIWRMRRAERVLRCVVRDDSDIGVDVQLLDGDDGLLATRHCADRAEANDVAHAWRQDSVGGGWKDESPPGRPG
jgi:hypothetical protein